MMKERLSYKAYERLTIVTGLFLENCCLSKFYSKKKTYDQHVFIYLFTERYWRSI